MNHAIQEFSSIFYLGYSSTEEDLCYMISNYKESEYAEIFEAIHTLGFMHREKFINPVIEIFKNVETFASKKRFMCFMLSRCMKLSEVPTFFSFLIVCAFVHEIMLRIWHDVECFTVAKMASKCLIAVFYRKYVDLFDKENGFEEFASYCSKLNATVLKSSEEDSETDSLDGFLDLEEFTPPNTDEVFELLWSLKNIDDSDFVLTDSEKKLLYERDSLPLDIDPSEDIFIPLNDGSKPKAIESWDIDVQNLNVNSIQLLTRAFDRCLICEESCYKHVVFLAKELKVCKI